VVQAPEGSAHHQGDPDDDPEGKKALCISKIPSDREAGSITNHRCARPRQQTQSIEAGFNY
jgi:hypothetical protein